MTDHELRDHFAGQALVGLLSNPRRDRAKSEYFTAAAYQMADSMMAAKNMPWKPIKTAPQDGSMFVAYSQETKRLGHLRLPPFISACSWHPDAGFCTDELREPTHWMTFAELLEILGAPRS